MYQHAAEKESSIGAAPGIVLLPLKYGGTLGAPMHLSACIPWPGVLQNVSVGRNQSCGQLPPPHSPALSKLLERGGSIGYAWPSDTAMVATWNMRTLWYAPSEIRFSVSLRSNV